jgi:hypothetical protein
MWHLHQQHDGYGMSSMATPGTIVQAVAIS